MDKNIVTYGEFELDGRIIRLTGKLGNDSSVWLTRVNGIIKLDLGTLRRIDSENPQLHLHPLIEWSEEFRQRCKSKAPETLRANST